MIGIASYGVGVRASRTMAATSAWFFFCVGTTFAQAPGAPLQSALAGAAVFGEKGCTICHAMAGAGESLGPDLYAASRERSFPDLAAAMWNHLPQMTDRMAELNVRQPRLNPQEAGDLIAYLYTLHYFAPAGDAERGRELFATEHCLMCHQVGGAGGVIGPPLDHVGGHGMPIEIATAMWNHGPAMLEALRATDIQRPALTESELRDLIAFLDRAADDRRDEAVHAVPGAADAGALVLEDKGCADCHGAPGAGGRIAPDLADRARGSGLAGFMTAMWNKMPAMKQAMDASGVAYPVLEADEMSNLVAYLYSIRYFDGGGSARRGRSLAASRQCLTCHTADDRGRGTAGDLMDTRGLDQPENVVAAMWNHVLVLDARSPGTSLPPLSGDEMTDLIAFFVQVSR